MQYTREKLNEKLLTIEKVVLEENRLNGHKLDKEQSLLLCEVFALIEKSLVNDLSENDMRKEYKKFKEISNNFDEIMGILDDLVDAINEVLK